MSQLGGNNAASTRIRQERAAVRRAIRDGSLTVASVLLDPPPATRDMRAFELLELAPRVGRVKIAALNLTAAAERVNLMRPVGALSQRSREWLIDALPPLQRNNGFLPISSRFPVDYGAQIEAPRAANAGAVAHQEVPL